jgi:hypothetical protein
VEQRAVTDPRRRRRRIALAGGVVLAGAVGAWLALRSPAETAAGAAPPAPVVAPEIRAPDSVRIRVQVLNATHTRGLARRATRYLRDRGFDVVDAGNTTPVRDSTLVLDLVSKPEWARLVAQALGGARVESRPDSSRYLDVTVVLGRSWRPPAEPFRP